MRRLLGEVAVMAFLVHPRSGASTCARHYHMLWDRPSAPDGPTAPTRRHTPLNTDADYFQLNRYRKICICDSIDEGGLISLGNIIITHFPKTLVTNLFFKGCSPVCI